MHGEKAMGRGLLVAAFDFSTAHTDEFHDWYDLEHIPERQAESLQNNWPSVFS
jgi:hypothetical protein